MTTKRVCRLRKPLTLERSYHLENLGYKLVTRPARSKQFRNADLDEPLADSYLDRWAGLVPNDIRFAPLNPLIFR